MNIHVPNHIPNKVGGGWTFTDNFIKHFGNASYEDSDIYFITGSSLVSHDQLDKAKADGKKIVLRIDNHLLPSRNRNTGMSKMKAHSSKADLVIYQSEWAKDYLSDFTGKDGVVILNGTSIKYRDSFAKSDDVLFVRSSRIPEKGWEMARYWYSRNHRNYGTLNIVGKFSSENLEYNFDFYNNEDFRFYGEQPREQLQALMLQKRYFLYSYFMDACSNTLIEALCSDMEVIDVYGMLKTGGALEIVQKFNQFGKKYFSMDRMVTEYKQAIESL